VPLLYFSRRHHHAVGGCAGLASFEFARLVEDGPERGRGPEGVVSEAPQIGIHRIGERGHVGAQTFVKALVRGRLTQGDGAVFEARKELPPGEEGVPLGVQFRQLFGVADDGLVAIAPDDLREA
jgi:hypothetical protein